MKRVGFLFIILIYTHNILGQGFFEGSDIISKTYSQRWELDSIDKKGTFRLVSYKPIYVTAGRVSNNPNERPTSENPAYTATETEEYGSNSPYTTILNSFCSELYLRSNRTDSTSVVSLGSICSPIGVAANCCVTCPKRNATTRINVKKCFVFMT